MDVITDFNLIMITTQEKKIPPCTHFTNRDLPAWINKYIYYKEWDEITKPFTNFTGATVEVWEWMIDFIAHLLIIYPCWD